MRKVSAGLVAAILVLATPGARAFTEPEGERPHTSSRLIRVSGGGAAISWVFGPAHRAFEEETGIDLDLRQTSPGQGLADLLEGKADVATGAVPLEVMIRLAAQQGASADASALAVAVVGESRTAIFLNKSNPVTHLSKEQLKAVFTGRVTRWNEVGGEERDIAVVWGQSSPGHNDLFSRAILDGETATPKAVRATDYKDIVARVAADAGAVGFGPEGLASGGIRVPETPEIKTEIIAVTRGEPSPEVKRLLEFLREIDAQF